MSKIFILSQFIYTAMVYLKCKSKYYKIYIISKGDFIFV